MDNSLPHRKRGRPRKLTTLESLTLDERIKKYSPYLQEIQSKLFSILIVFSTVAILGFLKYQKILGWIMHLFDLQGVNIVLTSPYQFFSLAINTGVTLGFVAAFPLLLYHLLSFLKPALAPEEYRMIVRLVPPAGLLFILGFAFGVWIVQFIITLYTQTTLDFSIGNLWDIGHFFSQLILTGLLLALIFQLPIIMTALMKLKLVKHNIFIKYRRYFYAGLLVIGALLPPTDIVSLLLLTVPPLFLFELALVLNRPGIDLDTRSAITK